jgi:hypothetical protein
MKPATESPHIVSGTHCWRQPEKRQARPAQSPKPQVPQASNTTLYVYIAPRCGGQKPKLSWGQRNLGSTLGHPSPTFWIHTPNPCTTAQRVQQVHNPATACRDETPHLRKILKTSVCNTLRAMLLHCAAIWHSSLRGRPPARPSDIPNAATVSHTDGQPTHATINKYPCCGCKLRHPCLAQDRLSMQHFWRGMTRCYCTDTDKTSTDIALCHCMSPPRNPSL